MSRSPVIQDSENSNYDSATGQPIAKAMRDETIAMTEDEIAIVEGRAK